ncbi:polysaccharide deacetylase family protein [Thermocaproicibacter melissae]|uniref:polysaccharide deacetylase family protein n=1 Tax=Thermocaproicibacter melissae TaxID=2966552 RepID=UPI0024B273C1|nr:polysaccharide deacetylase family protein [Thermocaproicibacter melissae]WBY63645.1 polysaccharide deacetylase [Thermocaproicibacter melissae]
MALISVSLAVGLMFCTVSAMKTPLDDGVSAKQAVSSSGSFRPASSFLSRKVSSAAGSSKPVSSSAVSSAAAVSSRAVVSSAAASSAKPAPSSSKRPAKPASTKPVEEDPDPSETPSYQTSLPKEKTVYLTFDDGPSSLTKPLLDILDQYQVKATFFVVGVNDKNETRDLQEIVKRGQAIGVHSWTHNYRQIYASEEAFFADFDRMHKAILDATGVDTKICRFPGGSVNSFNAKTRREIIMGLKRRGYVYFDWNVCSEDAAKAKTPEEIYQYALNGVHQHRVSVVLFHNTAAKQATLQQLPRFLSTLKSEGYKFAVLDTSVDNSPFIFKG